MKKLTRAAVATVLGLGMAATGAMEANATPAALPAKVGGSIAPTQVVPATPVPTLFTTLRPGMRGARVVDLQNRLIRMGYLSYGSATGYYGPITTAAVRRVQRVYQHRVVNGILNRATWNTIKIVAARRPAPRPVSRARLDSRCLYGRVICIDKSTRKLRWVVNGRVVRTLDARFGIPGHRTAEGTFYVYLKDRMSWSYKYHAWMPYSLYFYGGQAVHYSSTFAAYGYNGGSHGCVNLRDYSGAAWLFSQARVGTKVVIYWS